MAVTVIDGTVEASEIKRRRGKYVIFRTLRFRDRQGQEHSLRNVVAADPVAGAVTTGAAGRFYLSRTLDVTGVHGLRLSNGTGAYAHFHQNEPLFLIFAAAGPILLVVAIAAGVDGVPLLPMILAPAFLAGWWFTRKARLDAAAHYRADVPPA